MISRRKVYILITAIFLSFFTIVQSKSFDSISELLERDARSNIFQEIKILKENNEDLKKEIEELENTAIQLADRNQVLNAIQDQIEKYAKLSGKNSIFGPGISMEIRGNITTPWAVDLVNEFFNSGAQAVSVNEIRIVNRTSGFDTLPHGQILLNGSILTDPIVFKVIGESSTLSNLIAFPGGILERLKKTFPEISISLEQKEIIQMD